MAVCIDINQYPRNANCVVASLLRCQVCDPFRNKLSMSAAGAAARTRAVRGRDISSTKVKLLPESLGKCTLLWGLCVCAPAAFVWRAGVELLWVHAGRRAAPRGGA